MAMHWELSIYLKNSLEIGLAFALGFLAGYSKDDSNCVVISQIYNCADKIFLVRELIRACYQKYDPPGLAIRLGT